MPVEVRSHEEFLSRAWRSKLQQVKVRSDDLDESFVWAVQFGHAVDQHLEQLMGACEECLLFLGEFGVP